MDQNNETEGVKTPRSKEGAEKSPVAAAVVITAIVVGFVVYAWQHSLVRGLEEELKQLRESPAAEEKTEVNGTSKQAASILGIFKSEEPARAIGEKDMSSLKNLSYQFVPENAGGELVVLEDKAALGDMTGDGLADAAVVIMKQADGYTFYNLAIVTAWGDTEYSAATVLLGDRIKVQEVKISEGVVSVNVLTHQVNDLIAEPTKPVTLRYKLGERGLETI